MRTTFIETLCALAEKDERIWLLCGDLGYSVLEVFASRFPNRYVNVGVAEQNMTGVAAGLAMTGKIVFTYSIANFPVMRCLEQIRNDICYHNLNVKIVAVGGGLAYGSAGYSHYAIEDLAVMRIMPNMTVMAPGDPIETKLVTTAIVNWPGPCYLRLGKAGEPVLHHTDPDFQIGASLKMLEGSDITLISTGGTLALVLQAAEQLRQIGCKAQVLSMPTVRPIDEMAIYNAVKTTGKIISVEEHGPGGLGSAISEVLAKTGLLFKYIPLFIKPDNRPTAGSQETLRTKQGISVDNIVKLAQSF